MDIKKSVELFIYFYIAVALIVFISGILINMQINNPDIFDSKYIFSFLAHYSSNIVVAIWLFFFAKKMKHNYILWTLFALTSHLFAAVIFLVVLLLEKYNTNKSIVPKSL